MQSTFQPGATMSEPISGTAAGIFSWKTALWLGALVGSGVLGGVIMAAFDPPKTRWLLFAQGAAAGIGSLFFGPVVVRILDHYANWFDASASTPLELLEVAAPVYLLIGALSWGCFAALAKLREIIRERGAGLVADKIGLNKPPTA